MAEMARAGGAAEGEQQQQMELMSGPELVQAAMLEAAAFAGQQRLCEQQLQQQQRVRVEQEAQGLQQQVARGLCGYDHPSDKGSNGVQLSSFPGVQPGQLFEPQQPQQQQQQEGPLLPPQQQQQQQQSPQPQQQLAGHRALMPDCLTVSGGSAGSGADLVSLLSPAPRGEEEEVLLQVGTAALLALDASLAAWTVVLCCCFDIALSWED
jgi:hypothetical protein